jgi:type I restriction-modification system DNA methylase subunit
MSEGLKQTIPLAIYKYRYYNLRDITIRQLRDNQIIAKGNYSNILSRKPDGLILDGKDVLVVVEYKDTKEFGTNKKQKKAIEQSLEIAIGLKSKILIATDGESSIWINALTNLPIVDENDIPIKYKFDYKKITGDEELEKLIDKINLSINKKNSKIVAPRLLDPYNLAKRIWQKIWINTGKEPEKCLYNVVELFIFKFLSDIGVLKPDLLLDFKTLYNLSLSSHEDTLTHYANVIRKKIKELFPKGDDSTTIINGTIFVTEKGNANLSQARLFCELLKDFHEYEKEYGTFQLIDKNFKTRLFESFLKQSAGIKRLGQFFTPRKIVQAIINMSDVSLLKDGAKICDPFCGVGGFLLEAINLNKTLKNQFRPKNGKIEQKVSVKGFDQGTDEKDDERTIILAKANMLIYLSDLIGEYHTENDIKLFSSIINDTFELVRDNLGTLKLNFSDDGYDIILSNPPYVSKGSKSIKNEITSRGFSDFYTFSGTGIEGQCIEWIIRNLKQKGQAIVIIPDSILRRSSDYILRQNILKYCYLDALVSLPVRAFYATPKKTYIIVLTKKEDQNEVQEYPIFAYLIQEIGETRDANRVETLITALVFYPPRRRDLTLASRKLDSRVAQT